MDVYGSNMLGYTVRIIMVVTVHYSRATNITKKHIAYIHETKTHSLMKMTDDGR